MSQPSRQETLERIRKELGGWNIPKGYISLRRAISHVCRAMFGEEAGREVSNRWKHYRKTRDDFLSTVFKNEAEKAEAEESLR